MRSFYFIRHGETAWNKLNIYQGANDIPLNETGLNQAKARAQSVKHFRTSKIYSSPLSRAWETAKIISEQIGSVPIELIPEFKEGQSVAVASYFLNKMGVTEMPNLERLNNLTQTPEQFRQEVKSGLEKVLSHPTNEELVIVAHGGTFIAICEVLGVEAFSTNNCCLVHFEFKDGRFQCFEN